MLKRNTGPGKWGQVRTRGMRGPRGVTTLALVLCCASCVSAFNIPMLGSGRISSPAGVFAPASCQHPRAPLSRGGTRPGARCGRWGALRMSSDEDGGSSRWSSLQQVEFYYGDESEVPAAEEGVGAAARNLGRVEEIGPRTDALPRTPPISTASLRDKLQCSLAPPCFLLSISQPPRGCNC